MVTNIKHYFLQNMSTISKCLGSLSEFLIHIKAEPPSRGRRTRGGGRARAPPRVEPALTPPSPTPQPQAAYIRAFMRERADGGVTSTQCDANWLDSLCRAGPVNRPAACLQSRAHDGITNIAILL